MPKRFSRKLPEGFQADNLGSCMYAIYLLTERNVARGFTDFKVVEGKLEFFDRRGKFHRDLHSWIELSNGKIYDPTFNQLLKYPLEEQPVTDITYCSKTYEEYTPEQILENGCDITDEFKAFHYKKTEVGEYFIGAMWKYEVENPDLIPIKFRRIENESK